MLKTDIMLRNTNLGSDLQISSTGDIQLVTGEMNLAQAILHRIKTIEGELFDIGHSLYGSRIFDFIGEINTVTTRQRLKNHVKSVLLQEPRVKEIVMLNVRSLGKETSFVQRSKPENLEKIGSNENSSTLMETHTKSPNMLSQYDLLNTVEVDITILPINSNVPINIVFPFYLDVLV